jgi:aarF domain-containing kinase
VKQAADYMPKAQLEKQLVKELGPEWRSKFLDFDMVPMAAASIGQVHKARLLDNSEVAVKVQYPYVADSITSDLNNLRMLVNMSNVLPPGLFIDQIIKVAGIKGHIRHILTQHVQHYTIHTTRTISYITYNTYHPR